MTHSISTLLTRNLQDVFGENDPCALGRSHRRDVHRRLRVLRSQQGASYRGRDEIDRIAGAIQGYSP